MCLYFVFIFILFVADICNTLKLFDRKKEIYGYNIIRPDHPHTQKRGGVCIYFKEQLKLKQIITPNFSECILCEISMGNKIG